MVKIKVYEKIEKNLEIIKEIMHIGISQDAILREFAIYKNGKNIPAFLTYYEGVASGDSIDEFIMQSIHLIPQNKDEDLKKSMKNSLLSANQLTETNDFDKVVEMVNYGGCAVFVDGIDFAFVLDVKGWQRRGISEPLTENVIRGSQEAFIESVRVNTGMIRRLVRDKDLLCEGFKIGKKSKTPLNLLYIKGVADEKTVDEIKRRIEKIDTEYITDSGELEQILEDFTFFPSPQMISTERPDRAVSAILEGKIVAVLDGTPFVLIMPINAFELFHTPEDKSLRFWYVNFVRVMRILSVIISLLLPAVLIAVCNYHREAVPVNLLFAISSSRNGVPFSLIVELILFETAFEIIREASIRIPSLSGNAMGIIGGLIIGQAAIDASIVSPIVIICVALTGICSFAIPNYSITFTFRIIKYVHIILAYFMGMFGVGVGVFLHLLLLCNSQSFGIPFLAPFVNSEKDYSGKLFEKPIWKRKAYHSPRKWASGINSTKTPVDKITIE